MTRLTKSQFHQRQNWDENKRRLYRAGQMARTEGLTLNACPLLGNYVGTRAVELSEAWKSGWRDKDAELKPVDSWLPYKE